MAINTNFIKSIGIGIAISAFIALQYSLMIKPNSCQGECQALALKDDILACSTKCKDEPVPKKKLLLISFVVLCGFLIGTQILDGIFILKDPKYINFLDNLYITIKKRYQFKSIIDEENSLSIPLFES